MTRRLLLISTSAVYGQGYLDHPESEIRDFLGGADRILFVPFALHDHEAYAAKVAARFALLERTVESLHAAPDPMAAIAAAAAIFIGGGNTFRLLDALYGRRLLETIRRRVAAGAPYIGSSAGSNVACVTIKTTNDMPIVLPPSLDALGLVPFNINPHYLDPDPGSRHMGETREQRILEFHEMNDPPVVGLREGAMLRVEGARMELKGTVGARLFRKGQPPQEFSPGANLDFLLRSES
jgi:dipeptidase E